MGHVEGVLFPVPVGREQRIDLCVDETRLPLLHRLPLVWFPRRAPVVTHADDTVVVIEQACANPDFRVR